MRKRTLALTLGVVALVAALATFGVSSLINQGQASGQSLSFHRAFGTDYYSENISLTQFPVGASVVFQGVNFTRIPFTYLSNAPAGFNVTYTFVSDGFHGSGAVPSGDGNWASSTDTSTGRIAGYAVYPSTGVIELLVKG